jgi:hypothetical protein
MDEREFSSPVCYLREEDFFDVPRAPEPKGLCNNCRGVLESCSWSWGGRQDLLSDPCPAYVDNDPAPFHVDSTYDLLEDAARNGCPVCLILLESIPVASTNILKISNKDVKQDNESYESTKITIDYRISQNSNFMIIQLYQESYGSHKNRVFLSGRRIYITPTDGLFTSNKQFPLN